MNILELSIRCLLRKRTKTILLLSVVFVTSCFIYAGWACRSANVQMQTEGKQAIVPPSGGKRLYIGRMAKNFRPVFEISVLHLCLSFHFICLSFPASQNNRKSADKLSDG